jgi:hypothetical protein
MANELGQRFPKRRRRKETKAWADRPRNTLRKDQALTARQTEASLKVGAQKAGLKMGAALFIKIDQPNFKFMSIERDFGQRDREAKPSRTDTARVNVQNATAPIDSGLM